MSERNETLQMTFMDGRGRAIKREINQTLDIRDFYGLGGYPLLVLAANPHLSLWDIVRWLEHVADTVPTCEGFCRPKSWVHKRRGLFRRRITAQAYDPDGNHARAIRLMGEHPTLSARNLSKLLRDYGIKRSKDWVRMHRCAALSGD